MRVVGVVMRVAGLEVLKGDGDDEGGGGGFGRGRVDSSVDRGCS